MWSILASLGYNLTLKKRPNIFFSIWSVSHQKGLPLYTLTACPKFIAFSLLHRPILSSLDTSLCSSNFHLSLFYSPSLTLFHHFLFIHPVGIFLWHHFPFPSYWILFLVWISVLAAHDSPVPHHLCILSGAFLGSIISTFLLLSSCWYTL